MLSCDVVRTSGLQVSYGINPESNVDPRDPRFIRKFKREYCVDAFAEHVVTKRVRKLWRRKDDEFEYPFKEKKGFTGSST